MLAQAYAWALRRAFKFLLKRALGRFLRDDLDAEQLDVASAEGSAEVTHEEDDRRAGPERLAKVMRSREVIALDGQVEGRVVDVGRAHDARQFARHRPVDASAGDRLQR